MSDERDRILARTTCSRTCIAAMTMDQYTVSEWSLSSLNLMWYVAIPAPATGSDTTLNADGPMQIGAICRRKGS